MTNTNAFRPVVHEKICEDLSKFALFSPFILTNMNTHPQECFLLSLVETGLVVLEKNIY